MGRFLNIGNDSFAEIIRTDYVDKTGLIELINKTIDTKNKLTCVSRPRRFGKSYAAQMLCAYYDCTCDSKTLFKNLSIEKYDDFETHLNKYNVIYIDITAFLSECISDGLSIANITSTLIESLRKELIEASGAPADASLYDSLISLVENTGRKIVFIIDEWDAIIRESKGNEKIQIAYLNFLRGIFKNGNITTKVVAAAYMTGILPIKKDGTESAVSDFNEYSILNPAKFAEFTGFTEEEVKAFCEKNGLSARDMKKWYDGYSFSGISSIYNPYSVMKAIEMESIESYWRGSSSTNALFQYVNMNYEGLQDDIVRLIAGESLTVDVNGFNNDVTNFKNKDDVLALLIHLGYLVYDNVERTARIPNEEIKGEFLDLLKNSNGTRLAELVRASDLLLKDTLALNEDAVAEAIDRIRNSNYAPTYYNNEQALRYIIKFAYITCVDQYFKVEELPS
ncbi:MAG: AAA family ATPase, partial [Pseudobutyrivibrio sp.]|nr:AAA family ATPase [Pseudobutyrivibrio sp.]